MSYFSTANHRSKRRSVRLKAKSCGENGPGHLGFNTVEKPKKRLCKSKGEDFRYMLPVTLKMPRKRVFKNWDGVTVKRHVSSQTHRSTICCMCLEDFSEKNLSEFDLTSVCFSRKTRESRHITHCCLSTPSALVHKKLVNSHKAHLQRTKSYKRVCKGCFERSIVAACTNGNVCFNVRLKTAGIKCPVCLSEDRHVYLNIPALMLILSTDVCRTVRSALDRCHIEHTNPMFHCPINDCLYMEPRMCMPPGRFQILKCPSHGNQCAYCWHSITVCEELQHECSGLPDVLLDVQAAADIRQCPYCHLRMQRAGKECTDVRCKCSRHFDWLDAKIVISVKENSKCKVKVDSAGCAKQKKKK